MILALISVGFVTARSFFEASMLRSVLGEIEEFRMMFTQFKKKYDHLPGDIPNATDHFTNTINGDGNGEIQWDVNAGDGDAHESMMAWKHLQQAEILGGDPLSGIGGRAILGENVPRSVMPNAGYYVDHENVDTTNVIVMVGNYIGLGKEGVFTTNRPVFTTEQALMIDAKLDDGKPYGAGRVIGWGTHCVRSPSYEYDTKREGPACALFFKLDP